MIWVMLRSGDPSGTRNRAKSMGISEEQLAKIFGTNSFDEVKAFIMELVEEKYRKYEKQIEDVSKTYQQSWNEINNFFFEKIEQITEQRWKFDEYLAVLSPFHPGVSNRTYYKVIRWIFEEPKQQRRITAHEILLIHLWDIFDKKLANYYADPKEEQMKMHLWALSEITAVAILGLEPELNNLWTSDKAGFDTFLRNYPQLNDLKMELKEIYLAKISFQDYLDKAVAHLKNKYSARMLSFSFYLVHLNRT